MLFIIWSWSIWTIIDLSSLLKRAIKSEKISPKWTLFVYYCAEPNIIWQLYISVLRWPNKCCQTKDSFTNAIWINIGTDNISLLHTYNLQTLVVRLKGNLISRVKYYRRKLKSNKNVNGSKTFALCFLATNFALYFNDAKWK